MALDNLPVFTFLPDWANQVNETLTWLTAVLAANRPGANGSGAEQRRMMRLSPRRMFEYEIIVDRQDRTHFDLLMHAAGASDLWVPIFHNIDLVTTALTAGDSSFPIFADFYGELPQDTVNGGPVILLGQGGFSDYEIFEGYLDPDGNNFHVLTEGGLAKSWRKGTRLIPLMRAKIAQQASFSDVTSNVRTSTIQFVSVGPQDWTSRGGEGFDSYGGYPVMARPPNYSNALAGQFQRMITTIDNDTGLMTYADMSGRGYGTQTHSWFVITRKDHAAVRDMLYFLRGQLTGFWMPTFNNDLDIVSPAHSGESAIHIKAIGYTDLGFPVEGRDTIIVFMADGSRQYATITGSATGDDGVEVLTLAEPLVVDLYPDKVLKISFLAYSRFAQDALEIAHMTDNKGLSTVTANISAISYDRLAADWNPPALNNPDMLTTGCGFVPSLFVEAEGPSQSACSLVPQAYGFSLLEVDESPAPEDHIDYVRCMMGTNGDIDFRWKFLQSTFTILYGFIRSRGTIIDNRPSTRAGQPWSVDYDLVFFCDTNAICGQNIITTLRPDAGKDIFEQGCSIPAGWVPSVNLISVSLSVSKAGIGVGATNVDYTFGIRFVAAGANHDYSFDQIPRTGEPEMPLTGTEFDFHVSIRGDGVGNVRFILSSAYHGTAVDQTFAAPEETTLFDFFPVHRLQAGGRASNSDIPILESHFAVQNMTVLA